MTDVSAEQELIEDYNLLEDTNLVEYLRWADRECRPGLRELLVDLVETRGVMFALKKAAAKFDNDELTYTAFGELVEQILVDWGILDEDEEDEEDEDDGDDLPEKKVVEVEGTHDA